MADPSSSDPARDERVVALRSFHAAVDARANRLAARHVERLQCRRGCASCCVDGIEVQDVEAERIRQQHPDLLRDGRPHPQGACAFLADDDVCRIYRDRPYVCRTQGLPLRWFEETDSAEVVERRDICPLNDSGTPLEELPDEDCWLLGPSEAELSEIARGGSADSAGTGSAPTRVALRSLFHRSR